MGCLESLLAQANETREADFFTAPALMLAFTTLQQGQLSAAQVVAVRAFVVKTFKPVTPGSNNQHYQRAVGLTLAARSFPDAAAAAGWKRYAEQVWGLVAAVGATVGAVDGLADGLALGKTLGLSLGLGVGAHVSKQSHSHSGNPDDSYGSETTLLPCVNTMF